jgi:hypothetical protein
LCSEISAKTVVKINVDISQYISSSLKRISDCSSKGINNVNTGVSLKYNAVQLGASVSTHKAHGFTFLRTLFVSEFAARIENLTTNSLPMLSLHFVFCYTYAYNLK